VDSDPKKNLAQGAQSIYPHSSALTPTKRGSVLVLSSVFLPGLDSLRAKMASCTKMASSQLILGFVEDCIFFGCRGQKLIPPAAGFGLSELVIPVKNLHEHCLLMFKTISNFV